MPSPSRRRVWMGLLVLLLTAASVELAAVAAHRLVYGEWLSPSRLDEARRSVVAAEGASGTPGRPASGPEALHPFVGFVYDPAKDGARSRAFHRKPISPYGFLDDASPLQKRSPERFVVGLFGGSVAYWLSVVGERELVAAIGRHESVAGREVVLVRHALGGYKQPQQLMALAYHLSLGAEYDLVLNVDGFNEVALPPVENVPYGVFPHYPAHWFLRAGGLEDPRVLAIAADREALRRRRVRLAQRLLDSPARRSALANLVWRIRDRRLEAEAVAQGRRADLARGEPTRIAVHGPPVAYETEADLYEDLVRVWAASSLQMSYLAAANGAAYVHVLQPNQYVPESKPMGAAERGIALRADHPYRAGATRGYPLLREAGAELGRRGVAFHDLTMLFRDTAEPVYADDCCHLDEHGNELLARAVGAAVRERLSRGP